MQLDRALKVALVTKNSGKNILVHIRFEILEYRLSACIHHHTSIPHISLSAGGPNEVRVMRGRSSAWLAAEMGPAASREIIHRDAMVLSRRRTTKK